MDKDYKCSSNKRKFDKRGAISFKNLTMKLHHILMREYYCNECKFWHLATVSTNKKKRFNHNKEI